MTSHVREMDRVKFSNGSTKPPKEEGFFRRLDSRTHLADAGMRNSVTSGKRNGRGELQTLVPPESFQAVFLSASTEAYSTSTGASGATPKISRTTSEST